MIRSKLGKIKMEIKNKFIVNKTQEYGSWWQEQNYDFYDEIYNITPEIHEKFLKWLNDKKLEKILEIGCGDGRYGRNVFKNYKYFGIDINKNVIMENNKNDKNKDHFYRAGDFIKDKFYDDKKYDLVFNLSVIDHVYDVQEFIKKCVSVSKKYVWISAYMGYFPQLKSHQHEWSEQYKCYHNKLSVDQLKKQLDSLNVNYQVECFPYENKVEKNMKNATNIIIKKF